MYRMRWIDNFGFERACAARSVGVAGDGDPQDFVGRHTGHFWCCGCAYGFVVWPIGCLALVGLGSEALARAGYGRQI